MNNTSNLKDVCEIYPRKIDVDALAGFLEEKARSHNHYKIYTNRKYLDSWKNEKGLFLSSGQNWNDPVDSGSFRRQNDKDFRYFALCMSFSQSENIAMWMLYGGMERTGVLIDFTQSMMKDVCAKQTVTVGKWDNAVFTPYAEIVNPVIRLTEILYYSDSKDENKKYQIDGKESFSIKRSNSVAHILEEEKNRIKDALFGCCKAYPWNYENECRLIVKVNRKQIPQEFDSDELVLKIPVGDLFYQQLIDKERIIDSPNAYSSEYKASRLKKNKLGFM